jgi:hypothetical protein
MGSVIVLPRTFLHRTRWGTAIFYDRQQGLLTRDEAERWRPIAPDELRRVYPEVYAVRLRFAATVPASMRATGTSQRIGRDHAA